MASSMTPPSSGRDNQADLAEDMKILNELGDQTDESVDKEEPDEESSEESDEPKKVKDKVVKEGEEEEEKEEEEEEDEKGDEEKDKEPEPDIIHHSRPTVQSIKSKYPDFFRDFPDMKHVLFREGEYTQLFPTVDDAKEAHEKVNDFDHLTDLFTSGKKEDLDEFLSGVAKEGPKVITNLASNFLPSLYKTDRDLYFKVTTPLAESLVRNAHQRAVAENNENLKNAALVVAQWAFGDTKYATGEKSSEMPKVEQTKDPELENERNAFYREKYMDARTYVDSNGANRIRAEVKKTLDPNDVFNPFMSDLLLKKIMDEIGETLERDQRHMATMNSLWKQAHRAGFAGNWKDRILTTYLSRARAVMPAIRQRIRAEALKTEQNRSDDTRKIADKSVDRKEVSGNSSSGGRLGNGKQYTAKQIDWSNTSDMDILNDQPKFKR